MNPARHFLEGMHSRGRYIGYTNFLLNFKNSIMFYLINHFQEFRCPFENNCKIDPVTRRFCQKCRLKKCLDIGMKKEFIMSEEERTVKRRKIEENRMKKTKPINQVKGNHSKKQLGNLTSNNKRAVESNKKRNIKSEAESSYSDSDVSASPLDNNSPAESCLESSNLLNKMLPGSQHISLHKSRGNFSPFL